MPPVYVRGIVSHILSVPSAYPGSHLTSQTRTDPDLLPLDPTRQLLLVWDCMCNWIIEQLRLGNGVTAKGFGSFTFERSVKQLPGLIPELQHEGREFEVLTPRFVLAEPLLTEVSRQPSTDMLSKNHREKSIFQLKQMKFLNPAPIAAGCYIPTEVAASALNAFFKAITDLVRCNYDLNLDFKFCRVIIAEKRMTCQFHPGLRTIAQETLDQRRTKGPRAVSERWTKGGTEGSLQSMAAFIKTPSKAVESLSARSAPKSLSLSTRIQQTALQCVDDLSHISSLKLSAKPT